MGRPGSKLGGRGHVRRAANPDDGRSYRLQLTRDGVRAYERAGTAFLPVLDEVRRRLGQTEPSVVGSLATLRTAVQEAGSAPAAPPGTAQRRG